MSRMHNPAHPGEVLREFLPEGLAVTEAARRLGVSRQALSALLNARAGVSAEMALRLEGALGVSGDVDPRHFGGGRGLTTSADWYCEAHSRLMTDAAGSDQNGESSDSTARWALARSW